VEGHGDVVVVLMDVAAMANGATHRLARRFRVAL
jgi:hypothetical protein